MCILFDKNNRVNYHSVQKSGLCFLFSSPFFKKQNKTKDSSICFTGTCWLWSSSVVKLATPQSHPSSLCLWSAALKKKKIAALQYKISVSQCAACQMIPCVFWQL